jgi:hypothetical protein
MRNELFISAIVGLVPVLFGAAAQAQPDVTVSHLWHADEAGDPVPAPGAFSMAIDNRDAGTNEQHAGDIYFTGRIANPTSTTAPSMAVWKYDRFGNLQWTATFNADDTKDAYGVAIDVDRPYLANTPCRIYATGVFDGKYGKDIFTVCLDKDGNTIWTNRYDNAAVKGDDYPIQIVTRSVTYPMEQTYTVAVYVGGDSKGLTQTGTSADYDYAILKLDGANGNSAWGVQPGTSYALAARYDGTSHGTDNFAQMVVPPDATVSIPPQGSEVADLPEVEHVYATGVSLGYLTSKDYATIRANDSNPYSSTDPIIAVRTASAGDETATSIGATFNADLTPNSIFVTGYDNNTSSGMNEYLTVAYNANLSALTGGLYSWPRVYDNSGGGGNHFARRLVVASNGGGVYVTGDSWGGSGSNYDIATTAYDPYGGNYWTSAAGPTHRYNNPTASNEDRVSDMIADKDGNVYVAGRTWNGSTFDFVTYSLKAFNGTGRWSLSMPPGSSPDYPSQGFAANGTDLGACVRIGSIEFPIVNHLGDVVTFGTVLGYNPSGGKVVKYGLVRYCQADSTLGYTCP